MVWRRSFWLRYLPGGAPALEPVELPRGHVPALDAVRGLAVVAVTLYRFGGGGGGDGPASALAQPWLIALGSRGVDLFFVLSGFLITGILFDSKGQARYFRDFYIRRSLRIFPLYYLALAVVLFVLPLFSASLAEAVEPARAESAWLWLYGANVVQALRGAWCLGPLNHFWSLAIEEHFYLVWPAVICFASRRTAMAICGALFGFSVAGRALWLASGGNDVAAEVFTLLRMDGLVLGAWLALVARGEGGLSWLRWWAQPTLLFCVCAALAVDLLGRRLFGLPSALWAFTCGAFLILAVAAQQQGALGRFGHSRVLRFFGKYSYAMYVVQLPLIYVLAPRLTASGLAGAVGSNVLGQALYCAVLFAITTGLALVSWYSFEKPLLAFKRRFEHHGRPAISCGAGSWRAGPG